MTTTTELMEIADLLDRASNIRGPLSAETRARLFAAIDAPAQHWDDAHSITVKAEGWVTLWQAVDAHTDYEASAPTRTYTPGGELVGETGWSSVPTSEQIITALRMTLV